MMKGAALRQQIDSVSQRFFVIDDQRVLFEAGTIGPAWTFRLAACRGIIVQEVPECRFGGYDTIHQIEAGVTDT